MSYHISNIRDEEEELPAACRSLYTQVLISSYSVYSCYMYIIVKNQCGISTLLTGG